MKKYFLTLFLLTLFSSIFMLAGNMGLLKYNVSIEVIGEQTNEVNILNKTTFYGNLNQLTVNPSPNNEFCFFVERDYIVSLEEKYIFRMKHDHHFKAYFKEKNKYFVAFIDANDKLISFQEVEPNSPAIEPSLPKPKKGYQFLSWSSDFSNITSDTIIKAVYSKTDQTYEVDVEINGEIISDNFRIGQVANFTAPKDVNSLYFSHWEVNNQKFSTNYNLNISVYEDMDIKAIYSYAPHLDEVIIYLSDLVIENSDSLSFISRVEYSSNHQVIEYGLLIAPSSIQDEFDILNPNVTKFSAIKVNKYGEFAISIGKPTENIKVRAYAVVRSVFENKNIHTAYYTKINEVNVK